MKKVKDSRKRWKQLVTMLLVTALLVTGTPDIVGLASEGTQEQVTTAAAQSEGTQAEGQAEAAQEEEAMDTSVQQDTAAKQENTEKNIENRSTAGTTERSENSQNSHEKDKAASGAKSGGSSTLKVRETEKNTKKEDKDTKTEYTYRGSAIQAKVTLKDAEDLSDEADLRVKQTTVANKIKTQIINKAVGEENTQLVDSVKAYDLSFILNGESVTPSGSMQVTLANLGTKSGQNTLIYQVTDDGQVKNTDAVRTGSDAMQFAAKSLCTYVVLTYTTVSDVNGNDITTLYPAMVTATQTQLESKEDGNVPVESWTRTNTPLVLKDTTGKKALAWTWSDIAGIDLSLDNDSQIWNGSRSYGKHTSTALKNGRVTAKSGKLYDSALWKNEGKAGKDTTITRIRGEFTITDKNKNNYAYTLKPVTDSENIYAKDNMFVFVYPKDVELTDDNYMDYLAFWTGSLANAGEKERTFHGRTASNYTQRTPVENVSVLTDGWHMTAACNNAGSIITSTDASDYYVDVISITDSSNGGMYRFKLVKEKKEKTQFTFRNLDTNAKTGKGGAVFELYKDGVHYSAQSEDKEGRVTFNIVKPEGSDTDVYTLKETKAPEGYDKITTTWKVLVSSEGVTMVKDTEGNEMPKYPDGTYVVSSAKTDEADSTEQTAKTPSVIREYKSDDVKTYVIANKNETEKITVTIHHYQSGTNNKIYADDVKTLDVGASISDYTKAKNWAVTQVKLNNEEQSNTNFDLTGDSTIDVYYSPKEKNIETDVAFYDYTLKAGQVGNNYYSINQRSNYKNNGKKKLSAGTATNQQNYPSYCYSDWRGNLYDYNNEGKNIVTGLVKGLGTDGNVEFNYDEPGFFVNSDLTVENYFNSPYQKSTRYLRKYYNDYKLNFDQKGDTYTLKSVKHGQNTTNAGSNFFPLDDNKLSYEETDCKGDHNYYFGMRYDVEFTIGDYVGPLNYSFTGDDDLWVILDGKKVVVDLGGIHTAVTGTTDLWKDLKLNPTSLTEEQRSQKHTLTILYMERGGYASNCNMEFTLPSAEIVEVTKPKYSFTIHKESTDGKSLAGAEFKLTKDNETTSTTLTTASNGYATFLNLAAGSYTLEETQAPSGYEKLMDATGNPIQWTVTVNEQGEVTVKQKGSDTEVGKDVWDNYLICNPKVAQLPAPDHQKYIQSNGNDSYKLTLDVTGKVGEADPIDILLIVDKSGSMEGNGVTNVNNAIKTLKDTLIRANIRAQVKLAVVTFSGNDNRDGNDSPWDDADCPPEQDWIDLNNFNWRLNNPTGGTNWQAGIKKGEEVLQTGSGTKKYVVFLTDGNPTFRYNNSSGYTEGNGSNDLYGYNYNAAITEWNNSPTLKAATGKYVIDATSSESGNANCKALAQTLSGNAADYLTENYLKGKDAESITNSFEKIAKAIAYPSYNNVTITDTLSDYAEFTTNKDTKGRPVIKVYKGTKTYTKDTSGTTTGIQDVTQETELKEDTDYEYTYNSSTKTVTVKLNGDLKNGDLKNGELEQDITYWIEFDIKPTEKAYKEYLTNGGYGTTKGNLLTDAPGNTTSSDKPGFYSNSSAKVTYKVDKSNPKSADYDKPVIQVTPEKIDKTVTKTWDGTKQNSIKVKLTAKAGDLVLTNSNYKSLPSNDKMTVTLSENTQNAANSWMYKWTDLPKYYYKEDGTKQEISYSVHELETKDNTERALENGDITKNGDLYYIVGYTDADNSTTITNTELKGSIRVQKTDRDGNPLTGAEFEIKKKNSNGEYVSITNSDKKTTEIVNDSNSKDNGMAIARFDNLEVGEYQITETKAPEGYSLLAKPIIVTIPFAGDKAENGEGVYNYGNETLYFSIRTNVKNNKLFNMPASGGRFKATLIGIAVMIMAAGCYILRHRRKRII